MVVEMMLQIQNILEEEYFATLVRERVRYMIGTHQFVMDS